MAHAWLARSIVPILGACSILGACRPASPQSHGTRSRLTDPQSENAYPVEVLGSEETSFVPPLGREPPVEDPTSYDVIVVGGGPAGMTAALSLSDAKRRVLLLEKEPRLGGHAARGVSREGILYARGAAYWSVANAEEEKLLERIGVSAGASPAIPAPTDAYLWNGSLYVDVWNDQTLAALPASFELFRLEVERCGKEGRIPDQPMEESGSDLDLLNASEWIRRVPSQAENSTDVRVRAAHQRLLSERRRRPSDREPMSDVLDYLDLYCRSSLGTTCDKISALAFASFILGEIEARHGTITGTAGITEPLEALLREPARSVTIRLNSPVARIEDGPDGAVVTSTVDGRQHRARAGHVVYAMPLRFVPRLIQNLPQRAPDKALILRRLEYASAVVHEVTTEGHPYRAAYDTWIRPANTRSDDFTDVVLGRWLDPAIRAYEGMRDFARDPVDHNGMFVIYHVLPTSAAGRGFTRDQAVALARADVRRMTEIYAPVLRPPRGAHEGRIDVLSVQTSRWPFAFPIVKPGHFSRDARVLRRPIGHVFFATSNLGVPAIEEAIFRGYCAASNILGRLDKAYRIPTWSHCPLEPAVPLP